MRNTQMVPSTKIGVLKPVFQNTSVHHSPTHPGHGSSCFDPSGLGDRKNQSQEGGIQPLTDRFGLSCLEQQIMQLIARQPATSTLVSKKLAINPQTASRKLAGLASMGVVARERGIRRSQFGPGAYLYRLA